mgnify:FL=1
MLEEKTEAGFLKIRIRAFVSRRSTEENKALMAHPPEGAPKIEVRIISKDAESAARAASAVRAGFREQGFSVVEISTATTPSDSRLWVRGQTQISWVTDPRLGSFHSARARIQVEVIDPQTGAVVLEKSQEASALDLDSDIAAAKAKESAAALAGTAAAQDLTASLWKRF